MRISWATCSVSCRDETRIPRGKTGPGVCCMVIDFTYTICSLELLSAVGCRIGEGPIQCQAGRRHRRSPADKRLRSGRCRRQNQASSERYAHISSIPSSCIKRKYRTLGSGIIRRGIMGSSKEAGIPHRPGAGRSARGWLRPAGWIVSLLCCIAWFRQLGLFGSTTKASDVDRALRCSIDALHTDLSFLDSAVPITAEEFLVRRDRLARALKATDVDAFVLEPGYTFQYYGNISQPDWEPWEPEERPFLMLVLPQTLPSGEVVAKTTFLAPHFEEGRVRMLGIPSRESELDIVIWEEHWDPYATLRESRVFADAWAAGRTPRLMMDEEIRDYISRGLAETGFETVGLNQEVELVRQIKSPAEVELLRAVNTGTVVAVRTMRPCLVPGLTEDDVRDILDASLASIGFESFFDIVLFEEHGALPHGGFVTGGKKVTETSMIVIDVGSVAEQPWSQP